MDSAGVIRFVALPCTLGTAVGATVGAAIVSSFFETDYWKSWTVWWSGDFIGMLVTFPFLWMLLELTSPNGRRNFALKFRGRFSAVEFALLLFLVGLTCWYIFGLQNQSVAYAVFPLLLVLTVRFRVAGATSGVLILALTTVACSAAGKGLFGEIADITSRAVVLQIYLFVTATTFLTLAASSREKIAAQRAQEEAQRMLLSATRGGEVGLWDWDIGTGQVKWSDECHRQLGEPNGILSSFDDWENRVHPNDLAAANQNVADAVESSDGLYESTFRLRHFDGSYRWILSRGSIDFGSNGKPTRMSGSHIDITELVDVKEQLESYLSLLGATDGGWNWNLETNQIDFSKRFYEMLGFRGDEDEGLPESVEDLRSRIHSEDIKRLAASLKNHLRRQHPFESEFRIRMKDDSFRWFRARGQAMRDESDKPRRMAGSIYDITVRKNVELQLKASNSDLAQYAYVASHDLQEPLRAVMGFCQLLQQKYAQQLDEKANGYIQHVVEGSQRMKNLIDDLLQFAKVGRGVPETKLVDLNEVVATVTGTLERVIEESNAIVEVSPLPKVTGSEGLLTQLFQNLITNGLKFHAEGNQPKLTISSITREHEFEIRIADNGIGIAFEHQGQIFDLFERVHSRKEFSGTGIGLAICKRIVERHRGEIRAESAAGQGSVFVITLPTKI